MVFADVKIPSDSVCSFLNKNEIAPIMVKADKANILEHIISGFAHDVNNPMSLIMLSADILFENSASQGNGADHQVRHLASSINESADKINKLVSLLKCFNKPDDHGNILDLNEYVKKALALTDYNLKSSVDQVESHFAEQHLYLKGSGYDLYHLVTSVILNTSLALEQKNGLFRVVTEDKEGKFRLSVQNQIIGSEEECGLQEKKEVFFEDSSWWTAQYLAHSLNAQISFRLAEGMQAITDLYFNPFSLSDSKKH
ncbi:MAG: histidine kinase dimerization/phospho-acceptor domain-containing protein [Chitinispirillaceae bacterium]